MDAKVPIVSQVCSSGGGLFCGFLHPLKRRRVQMIYAKKKVVRSCGIFIKFVIIRVFGGYDII
jgi:hypothetical protein